MVESATIWKEETLQDNVKIRKFKSGQLFEWHFDEEDRIIEVIDVKGKWHFIIDNTIPVLLEKSTTVGIQKGIWHRLSCDDDSENSEITFRIQMLVDYNNI